jgi:uncharacterized protein YndB with AHSA1/START domain
MTASAQPHRSSTLSLPSEREVRIERVFDAPRELVWRAFTEPELLRQWWGRGHRLDIEQMNVRPGGHWRYVEHHDGTTDGFEGRYREVTPPERLVQTFEWDGLPGYPSINTAEFIDLGDGRTRLITTALFFHREERDGMIEAGMKEGLDESCAHLDDLLAGLG